MVAQVSQQLPVLLQALLQPGAVIWRKLFELFDGDLFVLAHLPSS